MNYRYKVVTGYGGWSVYDTKEEKAVRCDMGYGDAMVLAEKMESQERP